jgi:carbonic anhydrase/acetyltransferase-like protein (isoleucine patch superfamily)
MFDFVTELKQIRQSTFASRQEQAEKMAEITLPKWLALISQHSVSVVVIAMWGVSSALALKGFTLALGYHGVAQWLAFAALPFVFVISFVSMGGVFAQLTRAGLVEGKFPRKASHPMYAIRRIYGTAWSQIYYFKPLYAVCLAIPVFKKFLFRVFGYRGDLSFTTYPDSWIRDLPLLNLGKNVYLANRCVVGTNLCLNDGTILVGRCTALDGAMVGHLAIFGQGTVLGQKSEIGVGASTGIRVHTGEQVLISPKAIVYHAVQIGHHVRIGGFAVVGMKSKIADHIEIKAGSLIPPGTDLNTQQDADNIFKGETKKLSDQNDALFAILREQTSTGKSY